MPCWIKLNRVIIFVDNRISSESQKVACCSPMAVLRLTLNFTMTTWLLLWTQPSISTYIFFSVCQWCFPETIVTKFRVWFWKLWVIFYSKSWTWLLHRDYRTMYFWGSIWKESGHRHAMRNRRTKVGIEIRDDQGNNCKNVKNRNQIPQARVWIWHQPWLMSPCNFYTELLTGFTWGCEKSLFWSPGYHKLTPCLCKNWEDITPEKLHTLIHTAIRLDRLGFVWTRQNCYCLASLLEWSL